MNRQHLEVLPLVASFASQNHAVTSTRSIPNVGSGEGCAKKQGLYERLSKLLVHGQTMDDLGGSYRFTRIPSHVSVRYRFALVKVRRPSDSLILLVACPALSCPLLPFTALYCLLLSFTCPLLPFTALHCLLPPVTWPLRPFTALYCPSLPFTALHCPLLHGAVAHKTIW